MKPLEINDSLTIPVNELNVQFSRSSGPGGQNVNKVASKVTLFFNLNSNFLSQETIEQLKTLAVNKINKENQLYIVSQVTRDQHKNLDDARFKLKKLILQALEQPVERIDTKPTESSKNKRLDSKKLNSQKKQNRNFDFE